METLHVIQVDMDAFFAAVEQRDDPALRGLPVVVGGDPKARGVVSTASYEARKYGIHSAMPARQALTLCPDAVFLRPDMDKYRRVSRKVFQIFKKHARCVEPVSIDDVPGSGGGRRYRHGPSCQIRDQARHPPHRVGGGLLQ